MSEGFARTLLKNGNLNGILVSKGEFWIEVKDDNGYLNDTLHHGSGLGPTRGGGFDSASLNRFKEFVVGNRVSMKWSWDGHLRVHEIEVIRPSKGEGYVRRIFAGDW